jgi:hypothetical protein
MAEVVTSVDCRGCGAPLNLAPGEILLTCDYCGTVFNQATDKAFVLDHSIVPNTMDGKAVRKLVKSWMRGDTKPRTLRDSAKFEKVTLSYLPFFVINIVATSVYKGGMTRTGGWTLREGELKKEYFWKVLGRRGSSFPTREYDIPLSTKKKFDISKVPKDSKFLNSELDEKEAVTVCRQELEKHHRFLLSDDLDSIDKLNTTFEVDEVEFVHAPVWTVRYTFKGQDYEVLVDGGSGDIITGEVPPPDTSVKGFMATFRSALFGK